MNTCEIWCKIWFGKNGPKERGDLDSKQHEEVQADTDEAAAGGDTSDPAEGGDSLQSGKVMEGMIRLFHEGKWPERKSGPDPELGGKP